MNKSCQHFRSYIKIDLNLSKQIYYNIMFPDSILREKIMIKNCEKRVLQWNLQEALEGKKIIVPSSVKYIIINSISEFFQFAAYRRGQNHIFAFERARRTRRCLANWNGICIIRSILHSGWSYSGKCSWHGGRRWAQWLI